MRGVETRIQEIRHRIFREVARMAYHTEWPVDKRIEALPYKIIPGEVGNYRNDVFLERAIVGERLAMGLPCRSAAEHAPLSDNIEAADKPETYYTPPLINIIKFACNGCAEKRILVTEGCQGCLAHPCVEVCPKDAIHLDRYTGRSHIDPEKCIQCGRCADVCAYHAIIRQERPCAAACGMDAIHSDENGKAEIDYDKCVSCGMCLVNCPFGAIADKSQIFQVIRAIQSGERVYAAVAPAFVGQFGPKVTPGAPLPKEYTEENLELLEKGTCNLFHHVNTIKKSGINPVVCINRFYTDTDAEIALLKKLCKEHGVRCAESNHWRYGGEGAIELAKAVVEACEEPVNIKFLYDLDMPLRQRVELIAKEVYGADGVDWAPLATQKAERFESDPKYKDYCTMMVKTHLSLSDDPTKKGVPTGWRLAIRDILEYGGAKFLCPMAGTISMMPGTAANPAYRRIDVDTETGKVSGLF